ncbi:helix-turn-helix domain-containing protein [Plebeiibacterium marinum]|uniref:Helix-turn-helix domain-containing protein n=1 Tax=Plebeiibacterium marinum TaxID=2992111 RepID=A0AAE3MA62_9BACT|nr:helix-turn-helix domain-containing protein [Plebeiobacterium marinum]MCW3804071.1 helix-turn-helix domain-containing protein [Plebeiobacterium marinum]
MPQRHNSENKFIENLTSIVEENLSDENFGVKKLAEKACMSREQIYRKLKAYNNYSASQFIREIRLNKAKEMLLKSEKNISEIAYLVGFSSPSYFIKCFHEHFGHTPGEYINHLEEIKTQDIPKPTTYNPLKEINKKPIRAISLLMACSIAIITIFFWPKKNGTPSDISEKSIIVLPFKNYSNNASNQYLADGIMEDLLNFLFWISDLKVVSRTTSEQFRDTNLSTKEICKNMNVNYILEGSIRKQDSALKICTQLIDGKKDKHIWSKVFERETTDILGIQNEIAIQVAKELKSVISNQEMKQIKKLPTKNSEAYDAYLKGQFLLNKTNSSLRIDVDADAMFTSIKYFEKAIAMDSDFVQAYIGLANAHSGLSGWGYTPGINDWMIADSIIEKVLIIDPLLGEAHAMKGAIHFWGGKRNFDGALIEFEKALKLNPNYPPLYQWYAQLLMITGPMEDARKYVNKALEIEPYYWVTHNLSAYIHYFEEKYTEALKDCQTAQDLYKDYIFNNWLFFLNYIKLGEDEKAIKELQTILESNPKTTEYSKQIPAIYKLGGIKGIIKWIAEAQAQSTSPVAGIGRSPYIISWWYAMLGDKDNCIKWLNKCTERKSIGYMTSLAVSNPDFDFLRDDPRFLKFLEKIGVLKYHVKNSEKQKT